MNFQDAIHLFYSHRRFSPHFNSISILHYIYIAKIEILHHTNGIHNGLSIIWVNIPLENGVKFFLSCPLRLRIREWFHVYTLIS